MMTETYFEVPEHVRPFSGDFTHGHALIYRHNDDTEQHGTVIAIEIPERMESLRRALIQARDLKARFLAICDTREQALEVEKMADAILTRHYRVNLEASKHGHYGRLI